MGKQVLRWLVLVLAWATGFAASAGELATYKADGHHIVLRTERCVATGEQRLLKRAYKRSGNRWVKGCWFVNERGNPVLRWQGSRQVQEFKGSVFRFEPKYAALLGEPRSPKRRIREGLAARSSFSRPTWCKAAKQAHELLICRDRDLSAWDLQLAPLWRSYRSELRLSKSEQVRHKNEFYRRLKACGANKTCIAREQLARIRFYRKALALG